MRKTETFIFQTFLFLGAIALTSALSYGNFTCLDNRYLEGAPVLFVKTCGHEDDDNDPPLNCTKQGKYQGIWVNFSLPNNTPTWQWGSTKQRGVYEASLQQVIMRMPLLGGGFEVLWQWDFATSINWTACELIARGQTQSSADHEIENPDRFVSHWRDDLMQSKQEAYRRLLSDRKIGKNEGSHPNLSRASSGSLIWSVQGVHPDYGEIQLFSELKLDQDGSFFGQPYNTRDWYQLQWSINLANPTAPWPINEGGSFASNNFSLVANWQYRSVSASSQTTTASKYKLLKGDSRASSISLQDAVLWVWPYASLYHIWETRGGLGTQRSDQPYALELEQASSTVSIAIPLVDLLNGIIPELMNYTTMVKLDGSFAVYQPVEVSGAAMAGIVVGSVVGGLAVLLGVLLLALYIRPKRHQAINNSDETTSLI